MQERKKKKKGSMDIFLDTSFINRGYVTVATVKNFRGRYLGFSVKNIYLYLYFCMEYVTNK